MNKKKTEHQINRSLFSIWSYLFCFLLVSFVVSCSILLFFDEMDVSEEMVRNNAPKTLLNIFVLSLICTLIDGIRRKFTVKRPVIRILEATRKITDGDFNVRIKPFHHLEHSNEFDVMIENFNTMASELSGTETLRADFIANVSHELKTPLAVIHNYSTMLQSPTLPKEKQLEYVKTISQASQRLSDLITNILKLNKLENQQIFSESTTYNLGEQLCECLLNFENVWEKKELEISTDIEEDIIIKADSELLTLVWNNLFSNAIKFTNQGGKVAVSLKTVKDFAVIKVSDTGRGISTEIGQHIFEKFYQGDTSHATQGNGLGLALVKRVLDIISGNISIESEIGKGSTFIVKLRRDVCEEI